MSVVKPVSIRAAQWGTIAEDVKTGRVKALLGGRQVKDRYAHVFDVDNDIPIQSVNHESVLILEWQTPALVAEAAASIALDGITHSDPVQDRLAQLEAENERLRAALAAAELDKDIVDFSAGIVVQVDKAIETWPEIKNDNAPKALAEMRHLYEQKCAELDAANQRVTKTEFKVKSAHSDAEFHEERYRQQRDNFSMLWKAVAHNAPQVWDEVKDKLIDMSPSERDKTMSWAMRYRELEQKWRSLWSAYERLTKQFGALSSAASDVYDFEFEEDYSRSLRYLRRVMKVCRITFVRKIECEHLATQALRELDESESK